MCGEPAVAATESHKRANQATEGPGLVCWRLPRASCFAGDKESGGPMIRRAWMLRLVVLFGVLVNLPTAPATASSIDVVMINEKITLSNGGSGTASGPLTASNLTTDKVVLRLTVAAPSTCSISPQSAVIEAGRQTEVTVQLVGCHPEIGDGVSVTAASPLHTWTLPAVIASGSPNWHVLSWSLGVAGVLFLLLTFGVYLRWDGGRERRHLSTGLPSLREFDFSKSWASNATLVSGAFAAVFGSSDVLNSLLGDASKPTASLVLVSAAVSVGLVTAAPLVVLSTATKEGTIRAGGLLLAAWVTLTARVPSWAC